MSFSRSGFVGWCLLVFSAGVATTAGVIGYDGLIVNPWGLSATGLLVWGVVAHLVADWPLQSDWMAQNKARRRQLFAGQYLPVGRWFDRHPAAYVHASVHYAFLAAVFGAPAILLAGAHLVIDCRWVLEKWARLIGQTRPRGDDYISADAVDPHAPYEMNFDRGGPRVRWQMPAEDGSGFLLSQTPVFLKQLDRDRQELEARLLRRARPVFDMGTLVRMATDQVWHVVCIAVAALACAL